MMDNPFFILSVAWLFMLPVFFLIWDGVRGFMDGLDAYSRRIEANRAFVNREPEEPEDEAVITQHDEEPWRIRLEDKALPSRVRMMLRRDDVREELPEGWWELETGAIEARVLVIVHTRQNRPKPKQVGDKLDGIK